MRISDWSSDVCSSDLDLDSPLWSTMSYLREKEERDIAAGKGFRMQIFQPDSTKIATLTRGYAKIRSTDPKLQHPTDPTLLRQITPVEHARLKGVPATRSEEHTSELQSLMRVSYADLCLKKKTQQKS